jgi:hypothetical protein
MLPSVCNTTRCREGAPSAYGATRAGTRSIAHVATAVVVGGLGAMFVAVSSARAQERSWSPSRCVGDTLFVRRDSVEVSTADSVGPGITYRCILDGRGPWLLHVVSIDLAAKRYALDAARAKGAMFGRERVSAMIQRLAKTGDTAVVAINADFFDLQTGEIENNHVERGEWVKGVVVSDSPHDEFDGAHTQFGVDTLGRPLIGRFVLRGEARAVSGRAALVGINNRPPKMPGLVLYTPWFGARTPRDTARRIVRPRPRSPGVTPPAATADSTKERGVPVPPSVVRPTPTAGGVPAPSAAPSVPQLRADSARRLSLAAARNAIEVALRGMGRRGDTLLFRVVGEGQAGGGLGIPQNGAVLSGTGEARAFVRGAIARRGTIRVVARLDTPPTTPRAVVGGWPRLLLHGENVGARSDSLEGTFPRFSSGRHPRSAIAFTRDSSTLLLVVVDGRRPWSVGMSLGELAEALRSLGGWEAMNLDGGGSSTLWIRGSIVNYPSDATGERAVGNALLVFPRRRR